MHLYQWKAVASEPLNPHLSRQVIHVQNMTIARMDLRKGGVVPEHSHVNEQVCMVEHGALRFVLEGREQVVRAGECLAIPPNVPHRVDVLEDSVAVDLFSPPRQDWIDGDDAYLRR
jgi:quercetin dioxygenase-like cupin family protein